MKTPPFIIACIIQKIDTYSAKPEDQFVARDSTFEEYDKKRFGELQSWDIGRLLAPEGISKDPTIITDGAFMVLAVKQVINRRIIVCLNGRPLPGYSSSKVIPKVNFLETWNRNIDVLDILSVFSPRLADLLEEKMEVLYDIGALIFLTTFGSQNENADTLRPLDIIVAHNIVIKVDNFYPGFSFLLYDGKQFGRDLRKVDNIAENKSKIGKYKMVIFQPFLLSTFFICRKDAGETNWALLVHATVSRVHQCR